MSIKSHGASLAGALSALPAGLLFAWAMRAQRVEPLGLLGQAVPRTAGDWLAHLVATLVLGAIFGLFFGYTRGAWAATVSHGLIFGLMAWLVGPIALGSVAASAGGGWDLNAASLAFPSLVGHLLFGSTTAIGTQTLMFWLSDGTEAAAAITAAGRSPRRRVVVLGGGFGGVAAAAELSRRLARDPEIEVVLVSQSNYLLFTPLLASVAGGQLQAQHISAPLRAAAPRARLRHARAISIDPESRALRLRPHRAAGAERIGYEHLVLALGSVPHDFDLPGVQEHAFTLKRLQDAVRLRNHVLACLEGADAESDEESRRARLTFVAAGGGFAGTEVIAELRDLVRSVLRYYPSIDPSEPRFVLIHARDRILPEIGPELAEDARRHLEARGIELYLGCRLASLEEGRVRLDDGRDLRAHTLVWAGGNRPHPLLATLPCPHDSTGAVEVEASLQVRGYTDLWAIGDGARVADPSGPDGASYPPTAQHALRQGRQVADNIIRALEGRGDRLRPYRHRSLGTLVGLGHRHAVAQILGLRFSGFVAWLLWRGIYLSKLPGLEKRSRVLADWLLETIFPRDIVITGPTHTDPPAGFEQDRPKSDEEPDDA